MSDIKKGGKRRARRTVPGGPWTPALGALSAVILVAGLILLGAQAVSNSDRAGAAAGQLAPQKAPCRDALRLAVSPSYVAAWKSVASAHSEGERCESVAVTAVVSPELASGSVRGYDAWLPEDVSWVGRATASIAKSDTEVVAASPLVLAMPAPMSAALTDGERRVRGSDVVSLLRREQDWSDHGHPKWGNLRIALPDPAISATGAIGFGYLATLAAGGRLPDTLNYAAPTAAQARVIAVEHGVAATPPFDGDTLSVLGRVTDSAGPDDPAGPGLAVTTEAALFAHQLAHPSESWGAAVTGVGLRMPLVTLDDERSDDVAAFAAYLASDAGSKVQADWGLRPAGSTPSTDVPATAQAVEAVTNLFGFMHQRLSSLVVLDASGSMNADFPGSDVSRIDLVRSLGRSTMAVSSPHARSGLVTFQSDARDRPRVRVAVPLGENGAVSGGRSHAEQMVTAIDAVEASGGTPLYDALLVSYRRALKGYRDGYLNQIVVLSDGENRDARGSVTLPRLLKRLQAMSRADRPIRLVLLGCGEDADIATLQRIARELGGKSAWVRTLADVESATTSALFTP